MKGINSKLIHGDLTKVNPDPHRCLKTPVYEAASFDFDSAEAVEAAFMGRSDAFMYTRVSNPTVRELETRLMLLSGSKSGMCTSSGMAAISTVILSVCGTGNNIITSQFLFGNTFSFFTRTIKQFGIESRMADFQDDADIISKIDTNTRAIFLEVITNPQLIVYDFDKIAKIAKERNILLIVDNSVLTPYIFNSGKTGADIEIFSTTKFISGGATSIGGAIMTFESEKWAFVPRLKDDFANLPREKFYKKLYKEVYKNLGVCLSPNSAWLQLLGLETLGLRIERICDSALQVAAWLEQQAEVSSVNYASLKSSEYHEFAGKYMQNRAGCLIGLELESKEACYKFMNALKMVRRGTNFCDNKSMIIHPASTIFSDFSTDEKVFMQVGEGLLRLSVGLEEVEDIIDDLAQALSQI